METAIGEQIAALNRTPQVPGSRSGRNGTLSTKLLTDDHHISII